MRLSLTVSVVLALGLILPERVSLSRPPEDWEGSGYDLDGSGSGDDPEQEGNNNNPDPDIVPNPVKGNTNSAKSSSVLNVGRSHRRDGEAATELVVISNSNSLLENKEIVAAAIAGGVTGAIIGVLLSAFLIYKWRKKRKEELIQNKASNEEYHKPTQEVTFI
ncbi:syndecan-2-like isoform X1 [Poecilia reticulata]|uniref:syndecan-2-like isoform X1 n=1 Tax=Poecilia reticulata TaxID=8081 RepID=UPI0004A4FF6F|nr:PREDICTED: syndecan-2-like isoform X1 [Poecilia reticulata]